MKRAPNKDIVTALPITSGVYFFKNAKGEILYIGKAVNIRARIRGHFAQNMELLLPSRAKLYEEVTHIDYKETGSEIEALILESVLIKKHQPPYNVALKDDKNYFFVEFTKETYARVFVTHKSLEKREEEDTSRYVGPFTSGRALRETLRLLQRVFPYCTCTEKHKRPCMRFQLERCMGICCIRADRMEQYEAFFVGPNRTLKQKHAEYRRNVHSVKAILEGHSPRLLKTMRREMANTSRHQQFEEAAKLRDQISSLEWILAHARVLTKTALAPEDAPPNGAMVALQELLSTEKTPERLEAYDISNIQGNFAVGSMVVFEQGEPKKSDYRKFRVRSVRGANDIAMHAEVFTRRLKHLEWPLPDVIIVDGGIAQVNAYESILNVYTQEVAPDHPPVIIGFTKGSEHKGTHLTLPDKRTIPFEDLSNELKNLLTHIDNEAHRFAITYYRKLHRREAKG